MKFSLLALMCLLACGCTTSRVPLEPARRAATSIDDARILGRWVATKDATRMTAIIERHAGELRLDLSEVSSDAGEAADEPESYRLRIARFGEASYASIVRIGRKSRDWILFEYRFSGDDQVTVMLVDDDFVSDAVRKKLIRGEIHQHSPAAATLTASRTELRAFVLAHGREIFGGQQMIFLREP